MVLDEFGREKPSVGGRGGESSSHAGRGGSHPPPPPLHLHGPLMNERRERPHIHPPTPYHHHHHHHTNHSTGGSSKHRGPPSPRHKPPPPPGSRHPSFRYVEEPLLCEYLWKQKQQSKDNNNDNNDNNNSIRNEETNNSTEDENPKDSFSYDQYRRDYCLKYIRAFFNEHLDDTWFRSKYSPAGRLQWAQQERKRSMDEAQALRRELQESSSLRNDDVVWEGMSLSGGVKGGGHAQRSTPASHLFSWQQPSATTTALVVQDIPSSVTDEQLVIALLHHCSSASSESNTKQQSPPPNLDLKVYPTTHVPTAGRNALHRQVLVVGQTTVLQDIWKTLSKAQTSSSSTTPTRHVPRKEGDDESSSSLPPMELVVDCTDPYGRLEFDVDGRGGAPPDGSAVPLKKATVWVRAPWRISSQTNSAPTVVLSAALSASTRFASDRTAALKLAQAWDRVKQIPDDRDIDAVLETLLVGATSSDEQVLDVCIAYLRRVHLVSFYNGCDQPAPAIADVLVGKHPANSIYLRLQNAAAILEAATEQENNNSDDKSAAPAKDMLVQRLDESLEKALQSVAERESSITASEVLEEDAQQSLQLGLPADVIDKANKIKSQEERVKDRWVQDHSLIDDDQRARCSFHFCHKLFKDTSFLQKHLSKKHVEYLAAEQAKCHDEYMMEAWDAASERPVPDILVDCGSRFSLVAASVSGQVPDCVDPEPELWKREEERQEKEKQERTRREEMRHQHNNYTPRDSMGSNGSGVTPMKRSNFVDVDDVQVEKVELSFDNVAVAPVVNKKKKKKRKLL